MAQKMSSALALSIFGSFLVALVLTLIPLPDWARTFRPEWVPLVLIYWSMALPEDVGVGIAWILGLVVDATLNSLLGTHALGFALTAFITIQMYHSVRVFPLAQQAFVVPLILLPYMSLTLWIRGVTGHPPSTWTYWAPLLSSALLWPWVFIMLRALRRLST